MFSLYNSIPSFIEKICHYTTDSVTLYTWYCVLPRAEYYGQFSTQYKTVLESPAIGRKESDMKVLNWTQIGDSLPSVIGGRYDLFLETLANKLPGNMRAQKSF